MAACPGRPACETIAVPPRTPLVTLLRHALLTVVATFVLLLIGGTVNPTGSSLACPDWPLCYGELLPEMKGGVLFENSHRLAAELVGLLTIVLGIGLWRRARHDRALRLLGVTAVAAVLLQGALGGITVLFHLPTLVSTAHLALALGFFLLLLYVAARLRAGGPGTGEVVPRGLALGLMILTYAQVVLGGFVRHTGANRACGLDFPTCGGAWWPELWAGRVHQGHRFVGMLLVPLILAGGLVLARRAAAAGRPLARALALTAPLLTLVQVGLGILTVLSGIGLWQVLLHFAGGLLLVACLYLTWLLLGPLGAQLAREEPVAEVAVAVAEAES